MLLRIEDIDAARCTPQLEAMMLADLEWVGFQWDEPPRRQSGHLDFYRENLATLARRGLVYPSTLSRTEIGRRVAELRVAGRTWPNDPDGAPLYPGGERELDEGQRAGIVNGGQDFSLRLDCALALRQAGLPLTWQEAPDGDFSRCAAVLADPLAWGDPVLARKDAPASYHLACVLDDALQGVTHVVRGRDLYAATALHRLLQALFGLRAPRYFHHPLVLDEKGAKLSKSLRSTALRHLRESGATAADVRRRIGL